jgi:glycosyltransferase involved in cell wall biosynthesis
MRILFLTHYYPPEVNAPANRVHEHARVWVEEGHDVTVLTGVPNHPLGALFDGYENRSQEEVIDGVRVVRTWMYVTPNSGFVKRIANYLLFMLTATLASLRLERPDVVVATSPQFFCGIAGAVVAKLKRRPFVLEVRDLWPDSIVQLGQLNNRAIIRLLEAIEGWLYRSASGVVVLTRAFARHVEARGVPSERIELVYNGIDAQAFRPRARDTALLTKHGLSDAFTVAYVGTLGLAHGLVQVLDAAVLLKDRMPDLQLVFIGDGADRERIEAEAKSRGLERVHFTGLLPRDEIPNWLSSLDVLLVMLRDLTVFETVIPSKIFEYLALERPIVLAAPRAGEIREMVEDARVGLSIDPEQPALLADAIAEIRDEPEAAAERAKRGHDWVMHGFRRDDLARRMSARLVEVAEGCP